MQGGGGEVVLPLHRYTHNWHLFHVDQNMAQLLIKYIWGFFSTVFTVLQTHENYVCVGRLKINTGK